MVKSNISLKPKDRIKQRIIRKLLKNFENQQKNLVKLVTNEDKNTKALTKTEVEVKKSHQQGIQDSQLERLESIKDHYFTFQLYNDLFTLLYSTLVFKWIQTDRVLLIVDNIRLGYQLELFLKFFRMNSVFLDSSMPVNTNKHYFNQFLRGIFTICIVLNKYNENSPNFADEVIQQTPIPATILYLNSIDPDLIESQCFNPNVKAIYHFISKDKKVIDFY